MKILLINKFYYLKGGAERYLFSLQQMLEDAGHTVIPFAMAHPKNTKSRYSKYFVSRVDLEEAKFSWQGLRAAGRVIYSFEAAKKLRALIDATKPDIAHLHNIYHQLSPSILKVLKEKRVPMVQTLHDYAYLSPSYTLFDHNAICERVKPHHYFAAVGHRCVKDSFFASLLDAAAYAWHRRAGLDERLVNRLIAPSAFLKKKFAEWGHATREMDVVPNCVDARAVQPTYDPGAEIVYLGRLSPEKGIDVLIAAMEKLPGERLRVIGAGPMEARLKKYCAEMKLRNVQFAGALSGEALAAAIASARFVVVPSLWYENAPYAILEAMAAGKAVVASCIGGIPEIVEDGVTGMLVPPGDVDALAKAIRSLSGIEGVIRSLGVAGRARVEQLFNPEAHLERILEIYDEVRGS